MCMHGSANKRHACQRRPTALGVGSHGQISETRAYPTCVDDGIVQAAASKPHS
ncbi:hypothetical protein T4E_11893 [Trichinella pseudospiralis]|uniref:Uncharacterized protein n=1 Tax=Trichinella pseudospiralis TaxID=6337 RepID=A0A0V0YHQ4_TRIPS|nr:hypothetical protein T4E_11893 [Trichinella pseudospiralis]